MEIFGSYMTKDHTLAGESVRICALDTFVAMMSGLIIFPACFAFGVEPDAGPSLIFKTLPNVFVSMPGGRIWGVLFFLFMIFAAVYAHGITPYLAAKEAGKFSLPVLFYLIVFAVIMFIGKLVMGKKNTLSKE